jgi:hypothetical protein
MIDINKMSNADILKSQLDEEGESLTKEEFEQVVGEITDFINDDPTVLFMEAYSHIMENLKEQRKERL